jgi:hypothetical protein
MFAMYRMLSISAFGCQAACSLFLYLLFVAVWRRPLVRSRWHLAAELNHQPGKLFSSRCFSCRRTSLADVAHRTWLIVTWPTSAATAATAHLRPPTIRGSFSPLPLLTHTSTFARSPAPTPTTEATATREAHSRSTK